MHLGAQIQQSAKQVLGVCEQKGTDKLQLDYDPRNPFDICSMTFTPIYRGNPYAEDPYTKARCASSSAALKRAKESCPCIYHLILACGDVSGFTSAFRRGEEALPCDLV